MKNKDEEELSPIEIKMMKMLKMRRMNMTKMMNMKGFLR